jgi:hypothetical protein
MKPNPTRRLVLPDYLDLTLSEARMVATVISEHADAHDERRRVRLARISGEAHVDIAGETWVIRSDSTAEQAAPRVPELVA